jgi:hypothetical protein
LENRKYRVKLRSPSPIPLVDAISVAINNNYLFTADLPFLPNFGVSKSSLHRPNLRTELRHYRRFWKCQALCSTIENALMARTTKVAVHLRTYGIEEKLGFKCFQRTKSTPWFNWYDFAVVAGLLHISLPPVLLLLKASFVFRSFINNICAMNSWLRFNRSGSCSLVCDPWW